MDDLGMHAPTGPPFFLDGGPEGYRATGCGGLGSGARDIVAAGTNRRGLSALQDGDRVELEIDGLGRLEINVRDDLKRKWARTTRLEHREQGGRGPFIAQISGKYARPS